MNIRFTTSLTPEDEKTIAPALLKAVTGILDLLPIAYMVRLETSDSTVFQWGGPEQGQSRESDGPIRRVTSVLDGALST